MNAQKVTDSIKKAIEEVVGMYLMDKPNLKETKVKKDDSGLKDISVIVGLASDKLEGVLIVSYDKEIIFDFMKNILGEEVKEINKEVIDASGEMTNQISGVFRRELEKAGLILEGSTPSIVTGNDHKIEIPSKIPRMAFLFEINGKELLVEFGLTRK
ncbi:chemotaxis protein CheX [Thermodesulfobacterium hydrogeniphilum]|uniref:chemotaxis protein CheX n=1 Tax=Thermodesulfobacterium hydrogeniphilum TaxID=161156 RepID=UPI00068DB5A2|nr:chemotaxis protein CheX [Thermodesulfobacterium hydrogeniphilum]